MGTVDEVGEGDPADAVAIAPAPPGDDRWARLQDLYRDEQPGLVRLATLLVDDRTLAEELVQDAFVRLHQHLDRADRPGAYLRTTVVNLCRSQARNDLGPHLVGRGVRTVARGPSVAGGTGVADDDGAARGDLDRLEQLYRDEYAGSVRLAHLLVGDRARAEELAQDAFVRLLPRLADADNPGGYLRTVLVNLCRDHHRREALARRHQSAPPPDVAPPGLPATSSAVWLALQGLPERQREALSLRFYADVPTDEIARLLDVRPATVRSLVHRGLATLKEVVPHDR